MKYWHIDLVLERTHAERGHTSREPILPCKGQVQSVLASEPYRLTQVTYVITTSFCHDVGVFRDYMGSQTTDSVPNSRQYLDGYY